MDIGPFEALSVSNIADIELGGDVQSVLGTIDALNYDFQFLMSFVREGESEDRTITVHNVGDKDLVVYDFAFGDTQWVA
ncbi:MAG: hypothetical protein GKR87_10790 [Kiritimatiellae bacterium]|nr:hypothetical protein [Kiritimatiellia bacterium]